MTENNTRTALTDENLGPFLLPIMRKHLSPVAIDHLTLGEEPTIGMRKFARAMLTKGRADGFTDCVDAIRGAIAFGQQGANQAAAHHWLAEFWDIGRRLAAPSLPAGDGLTDERIQKLWDEACNDGPGRPGWSRHIRFAKAVEQHAIAAFLDRSGQYLTNDAMREAAIAEALAAPRQSEEVGAGVEREWRIKVAGPAGYVRFVSFAGETLEDALENVRAQNYCAAPDEDGYISIEVKA